MKINFREEVLKRKDEIIKDLSNLIKINSELTTFDPKRIEAPFGEGNKEALDFMLHLGKKDGFNVLNVDNYAGHIEYGEGSEYVAMMGHLDVVPAGNDWTYPPYGAEIHNNKMYGRGTEDDKGPTIAAYYAMKILKELNVPLSKRIKLILGLDEESGWRCVDYYFKKHPETPVSGFIPDADFPLIYAEKGIVNVVIKGKFNNKVIESFNGGLRTNMVPDLATVKLNENLNVVIKGKFNNKVIESFNGGLRTNMVPDLATVKLNENLNLNDEFNKYLKDNNLVGNIKNNELSISGISAHGSTPELGRNAIDLLNDFLVSINLENDLVKLLDQKLSNDTLGKKLNINYHDNEMGNLTLNFGVIETIGDDFTLTLNIRYPNGVVFEELMDTIKNNLEGYDVSYNHHQKLLYNDPNSELVVKLMDVYKKHTNDLDAKPIVIGGGTFARALPNVVAYGPHFLGKPSYIHQRDEYIDIDDFLLATIIYTEALYELAK